MTNVKVVTFSSLQLLRLFVLNLQFVFMVWKWRSIWFSSRCWKFSHHGWNKSTVFIQKKNSKEKKDHGKCYIGSCECCIPEKIFLLKISPLREVVGNNIWTKSFILSQFKICFPRTFSSSFRSTLSRDEEHTKKGKSQNNILTFFHCYPDSSSFLSLGYRVWCRFLPRGILKQIFNFTCQSKGYWRTRFFIVEFPSFSTFCDRERGFCSVWGWWCD